MHTTLEPAGMKKIVVRKPGSVRLTTLQTDIYHLATTAARQMSPMRNWSEPGREFV